jgi:hypothetical protein
LYPVKSLATGITWNVSGETLLIISGRNVYKFYLFSLAKVVLMIVFRIRYPLLYPVQMINSGNFVSFHIVKFASIKFSVSLKPLNGIQSNVLCIPSTLYP